MKFVIVMKKGKETPGTNVYMADKMNAEGQPNAATSVYLNKEAHKGQPAPQQITVTIEA